MPPVPAANRSKKGSGDDTRPLPTEPARNSQLQNNSEQGQTANIKQNTTNKGYFHGRRMK